MPAATEKKSHMLRNIAAPVLLCVVAFVVARLNQRVSFKQDVLTPSVFTVKAGSIASFPFDVFKPGRVLGRFEATGGSGDDIEAVVTNARDWENWKNGREARVVYGSGRIAKGRIDIAVQPGQYFLAFDNRFSALADKTIAASVVLNQ
jgi:hypothetical protein